MRREVRLKRWEESLRERYLSTGDRRYVDVMRKVQIAHKYTLHRWENFGKLHWIKADWRTSHEQILEAAFSQNLTIAAIDCEYDNTPYAMALNEIGISIYRDGEIEALHFVVGRTGRRFRYGETQYLDREMARKEIQAIIDDIDVLLFWEKSGDVEALRHALKINLPKSKLLDLVFWKTRRTRSQHQEIEFYRLREFCELHGIEHIGIHNAGNDAYALLAATLTACNVTFTPIIRRDAKTSI